jgi:phage tail protein X
LSRTAGNSVTDRPVVAVEQPSGQEQTPDDFPLVLGRVPVAPGDTLGGLVQKIYGAYTFRHHQAVLAANPELTDPDSLIAGQELVFPAISADAETIPDTTWWVVVSRETDLDAAVTKLREEAGKGLPLRLLSTQNPEKTLSFRLVLKACFENEGLAEHAKEKLGALIPPVSEVFCLKKNETIVYSSII